MSAFSGFVNLIDGALDPFLPGWTVEVIGHTDHFGVTDQFGAYNIDTTDLNQFITYRLRLLHNENYVPTPDPSGDLVVGAFQSFNVTPNCKYVASPWVLRVCWIEGKGVKITFKDKLDGIPNENTFMYPGLTKDDWTLLCRCGNPGHLMDTIYKGATYYPYIKDS